MDKWRAQGLPEEEVLRREAERRDLVYATRARTMMLRKEQEALAAGLGDAAIVARTIDSTKKELTREFKNSPLKGVRHQTTVVKAVQKRQKQAKQFVDKQENPRIKGLAGVPGVTVDEDGKVGLRDLRQQRPDIFEKDPQNISSNKGRISIAKAVRARGGKDKYDHLIND